MLYWYQDQVYFNINTSSILIDRIPNALKINRDVAILFIKTNIHYIKIQLIFLQKKNDNNNEPKITLITCSGTREFPVLKAPEQRNSFRGTA